MESTATLARRVWPVLGISLCLGLIFDYFFYGKTPGITILLFTVLVMVGLWGLARFFKEPLRKETLLLMFPIALFAGMTFVRASALLSFLNIVIVLYLLLVLARLSGNKDEAIARYNVADCIGPILRLPIRFLQESIAAAPLLLRLKSGRAGSSKHVQIIRGLVITVPILILFMLLFMSADLVFQRAVTNIFNFHLSPNLFSHVMLIAFITAGFLGAYSYVFNRVRPEKTEAPGRQRDFKLGSTEVTILFGAVNALFLVFILIQLTYLFGGQANVGGEGFTFAEYARKGFFELMAVALLSLLLIWGAHKTVLRQTLHQSIRFKVLSLALIVQVGIIMVSAFKRLSLYEEAYGFTTLRFFSHLLLIWLAVIFVLLAIHIITEQKEQRLAWMTFASVLVFMAVANFVNPDAFIARQNIQRYKNTGKIDLYYLRGLSADAAEPVAALLNDADPAMQRTAAQTLSQWQNRYSNQQQGWQSTHLARLQAERIFKENQAMLEDNKNYQGPYPQNID